MTDAVSDWVFKMPRLFYALAIFFFFGYFALGVMEVRGAPYQYDEVDAFRMAILRVFLDSLREGAYMFSTGLWIDVMIHLWLRVIVKLQGKAE